MCSAATCGDSTTRRLFWALCNFLNDNAAEPYKTTKSTRRGHMWCDFPKVTKAGNILLGCRGEALTLRRAAASVASSRARALDRLWRRASDWSGFEFMARHGALTSVLGASYCMHRHRHLRRRRHRPWHPIPARQPTPHRS